jgi:hypothetical protein
MSDNVYRPGVQHPEEWRADLNPDAIDGPNFGEPGEHPEKDLLRAYDVKEIQRALRDMNDDELKALLVLPEGAWLKQGSTYVDLHDPQRREFTAQGNMVAGPDNWYVPKSETDYVLWNRLLGVTDPSRLDQPGGR